MTLFERISFGEEAGPGRGPYAKTVRCILVILFER